MFALYLAAILKVSAENSGKVIAVPAVADERSVDFFGTPIGAKLRRSTMIVYPLASSFVGPKMVDRYGCVRPSMRYSIGGLQSLMVLLSVKWHCYRVAACFERNARCRRGR